MHGKIYLDYAAATPLAPEVFKVMRPYFTDLFYNPSADYTAANEVRFKLEQARAKLAYYLGATPSEIVFTAGGTEANNLAIHGVMRRFPEANMLYSAVEHESIINPAANYEHKEVPVERDGRIDPDACLNLIDAKTALISVMYANNEVGTIQPIKQLARALATVRKQRRQEGNTLPLILHSDACQAGNYLDLHVNRLGVDLMTINGGKI
jgi:cysteine desulfurase